MATTNPNLLSNNDVPLDTLNNPCDEVRVVASSQPRGNRYLPPPAMLENMSKAQVSAWKAVGRRKRKNARQRLYRQMRKGAQTKSKHGNVYNPPDEEKAKMSKEQLTAWRTKQRRERKTAAQRLYREKMKAKASTQDDTEVQDKAVLTEVEHGFKQDVPFEVKSLEDSRICSNATKVEEPRIKVEKEFTPFNMDDYDVAKYGGNFDSAMADILGDDVVDANAFDTGNFDDDGSIKAEESCIEVEKEFTPFNMDDYDVSKYGGNFDSAMADILGDDVVDANAFGTGNLDDDGNISDIE